MTAGPGAPLLRTWSGVLVYECEGIRAWVRAEHPPQLWKCGNARELEAGRPAPTTHRWPQNLQAEAVFCCCRCPGHVGVASGPQGICGLTALLVWPREAPGGPRWSRLRPPCPTRPTRLRPPRPARAARLRLLLLPTLPQLRRVSDFGVSDPFSWRRSTPAPPPEPSSCVWNRLCPTRRSGRPTVRA